jgi:transposase-like protein
LNDPFPGTRPSPAAQVEARVSTVVSRQGFSSPTAFVRDLATWGQESRFTLERRRDIVLAWLQGRIPMVEIVRQHQISSTAIYRWRNQFVEGGYDLEAIRQGTANVLAALAGLEAPHEERVVDGRRPWPELQKRLGDRPDPEMGDAAR